MTIAVDLGRKATKQTKHEILVFSPLYSNGFSHTDRYNKAGIVHYISKGVTDRNFQIIFYFQSLRIVFILENRADPDEMLHSAAFHLGLLCFSKNPFRGF